MTYGLDSNDLYTRLWAQFFYIGGKVGVNCFVLITGYFLYDRAFKVEKIIKLHQKIIIYGIVCLLIGIAIIPSSLGLMSVVKTFFPIAFSHYWFITIYIGLICFSPFLNLFISKLSYIQHSIVILICLLLFSVIPTLTAQVPFNDNLSWFCFLYILAAYFRKYDTKIEKMLGRPIVVFLMWSGIFGSSLFMTMLEKFIPAFREGINFFSGMYILPEAVNSIALFLCFKKINFKSRTINIIGKHTLACYLIQSNYVFIYFRIKLLNFIFTSTNHLLYPVFAFIIMGAVFVCAIMIDILIEKFQNHGLMFVITNICVSLFEKSKVKVRNLIERNRDEENIKKNHLEIK